MKVTADPVVRITVDLEPGEFIVSMPGVRWSIIRLDVTIRKNHWTGNTLAHLEYPDHAFALRNLGKLRVTGWAKRAQWPGFYVRPEDIPAPVLAAITEAYAYRAGLPVCLPAFDVVNGVGE